MRRLLATTVVTGATAALIALAAPLLVAGPAQARPAAGASIEIKPGNIARGPDIKGPHLVGTTIVDGAVSVKLNAARAILYGKWHDQYVAATGNAQWGNVKLVRVTAAGATKQLVKGIDPFETLLDADADQVAYSYGDATSKPTIAVYDLGLGKEVNAKGFASLPVLLEFDEGFVVASFAEFNVKTLSWDTVSDDTVKLVAKQSDYASKAHDLLGYFNGDPQLGGCQVLARMSKPATVLWTSCDERIEAVSPDGKRLATIPLLSDGIGPADVVLRKVGGSQLAHYTISGWFGRVWWETPNKLLMESNGKTKSATVRCQVAVCDRATDLAPTPDI